MSHLSLWAWVRRRLQSTGQACCWADLSCVLAAGNLQLCDPWQIIFPSRGPIPALSKYIQLVAIVSQEKCCEKILYKRGEFQNVQSGLQLLLQWSSGTLQAIFGFFKFSKISFFFFLFIFPCKMALNCLEAKDDFELLTLVPSSSECWSQACATTSSLCGTGHELRSSQTLDKWLTNRARVSALLCYYRNEMEMAPICGCAWVGDLVRRQACAYIHCERGVFSVCLLPSCVMNKEDPGTSEKPSKALAGKIADFPEGNAGEVFYL